METALQVVKWGNSLAIRIPAVVAEILDLEEGDDLDLRAATGEAQELAWTPYIEGVYRRYVRLKDQVPSGWDFSGVVAAARRQGITT